MNTERRALLNRRVLVTRPVHQNIHLCHLIAADGGIPIQLPTLAIVAPADPARARAQLQRLKDFELGIFISRNAVEKTLELLGPERLPSHVKWLAVGRATAAALQKGGYTVDFMPERDFSSEGLLALPALQDVAGKHIVIFRGEGGRELLAGILRERGAAIEYIETYRRIRPPVAAGLLQEIFTPQAPELVTATSALVLENLVGMIGHDYHSRIKSRPLVVLSARARQYALAQGFSRIYIAPHSDDAGIVTALSRAAAESL